MSVQKKSLIGNLAAAKKAMIASGRMQKPEKVGGVRAPVSTAVRNQVSTAVRNQVSTAVRNQVSTAVKSTVR